MTRRIALVAIGLALMLGLYLYDRDNSTQIVVAGTVQSVEERDDAEGPGTWHITVQLPSGPATLAALQTRPDVAPDDKICITVTTRAGQPDTLHRAPAGTAC